MCEFKIQTLKWKVYVPHEQQVWILTVEFVVDLGKLFALRKGDHPLFASSKR